MKTFDNLLERYSDADEEQRIFMFLSHRDLRRQFTEIDMAESTRSAQRKNVFGDRRRTNRFAGCCRGWLKHCGLPR